MRNVMPLPIIGSVLVGVAILLLIPLLFRVNISINMTKKCLDLTVKLLGLITVANMNLCVDDVFLVATTKRKVKKLPLWNVEIKPPKGFYLVKAFELQKVRLLYNINVYALTKNNALTYFFVTSLFTANGVLLGNGIDSNSRLDITSEHSLLSIDLFVTVKIYKLIELFLKEGTVWKSKVKTKSSR